MKKILTVILAVLCIFSATGCKKRGDVSQIKLHQSILKIHDDLNNYTIDAKLDTSSDKLICTQEMLLTNRYGKSVDDLCFHLYPNAFRTRQAVPFEDDEMDEAYPDGFSAGGIDISNVKINGKDTKPVLKNHDQILSLKHKWKKNSSVKIQMEYTVTLPRCEGRFGRGKDTYKINNTFPILCIYNGNWLTDGYETIGDPFYSDVSNYKVTLTAPTSLIVAATGEPVEQSSDSSFTKCTYIADAVRDFALVASDKFIVSERKIGRTTVYSYSLSSQSDVALNAACKALKCFNKAFGEYPYNRLSVVCADFYVGGMEYPALIMLDRRMYSEDSKALLEYVTAHETAHQWWYGLVGNDQIREPWIDEALTEYSTMLYYDFNYGRKIYNEFFDICVTDGYENYAKDIVNERIDRATNQFSNSTEYSAIVYSKGAIMFRTMSELMGKENFIKALKKYCEKYRYKNVSKSELISSLEKYSDMPLAGVFDAWLYDRVRIE